MYLIFLILFPIKMSVICTLVTFILHLYLTFVMTLFQTILYLYYSIKLLINYIYNGNAPFLYFLILNLLQKLLEITTFFFKNKI